MVCVDVVAVVDVLLFLCARVLDCFRDCLFVRVCVCVFVCVVCCVLWVFAVCCM